MATGRADLLRGATLETAALASAAAFSGQQARLLAERAVQWAYDQMGVDTSTTADPTLTAAQAADAPWLVDYFMLRGVVRALAVADDVRTADEAEKRSQQFAQARLLLADAEAAIEARGYGVKNLVTLGRIQLDFLEPTLSVGGVPWWGGE